MTQRSNHAGKAFIASAVGICLLLGGSTYALWSANAPLNSESTITAGDLRVYSMSANNWFDVSKSAAPVELVDLSGFYMVPGDKLQLDQDMDLIIVGDNISGKLIVELPNSTESTALLAQAKFTVKLFNPEGEEIASVTSATNSNKIEAAVENLEPTSPTGATYGVQVQVELPAGADNATKLQAAVLEDAIITLEQGGKYVSPFRFGFDRLPNASLYENYDFTLTAASNKGTVSYSVSGLPSGMSFNAATGKITGKPSGNARTVPVTLTATDSLGGTISKVFDLVIPAGTFQIHRVYSFENGTEQFSASGSGSISSVVNPNALDGQKVLQIKSYDITNNAAGVNIPSSIFEAGRQYKITANVYSTNTAAAAIAFNYNLKRYSMTAIPVGEWKTVSMTFTAGSDYNGKTVNISSYISTSGNGNGGSTRAIWLMDNLTIEILK